MWLETSSATYRDKILMGPVFYHLPSQKYTPDVPFALVVLKF